ncbi:MAG TPA: hypothetical protein VGS11_00180 [Candidatus Bathyarchaeia archaeon]|nr:hypothetical protein [Candidatus Bathyarchaeia archaeon]
MDEQERKKEFRWPSWRSKNEGFSSELHNIGSDKEAKGTRWPSFKFKVPQLGESKQSEAKARRGEFPSLLKKEAE